MSVALGNSSTSTLANSLSLGPLTQAALDTVSSSSGAAGYSVVSALESYLNQLDQHSQNIRQSLNAIRSNASNKLLAKIFTPLAQMEAELSNISIATKSVKNSGSALSFLHLLTTDRSQGLANLTKSSGSIAAAFLNAPATVATRILSSGVNSLNQISATTASAASQFSGHPVIVTGLGAFNRQLGREAGALDTLNNLTQSWSGYDSQVISAVQNLVEGDVASWAEALGQSSPSNGALYSLQLPPGDLELAVTLICKQLQSHAGELKGKLEAAGATVEYAAANATTIKGFAAAIREELSSMREACETLQADSDLALVKAEASRQAAVKAGSALPFIGRPGDGGARETMVRDLETEKHRAGQLEAQLSLLRDENGRMQHYLKSTEGSLDALQRKEAELQSMKSTLMELWTKHEAANAELDRLRQLVGSSTLRPGSSTLSTGQVPQPTPPNYDRSSAAARRTSKSNGGMTPNVKNQLSSYKVASLEEQMNRLQRKCDEAEERAARAEAELRQRFPDGEGSASREIDKLLAKLKLKDKELQGAREQIDNLQWLQGKHKSLVDEYERVKASEASLVRQLSTAWDPSQGSSFQNPIFQVNNNVHPIPEKVTSLSSQVSSQSAVGVIPMASASMSRLSSQPPVGSPSATASPRAALLDRNRHSMAGHGTNPESPLKTNLQSPPSPAIQLSKIRGHGSSPGENGFTYTEVGLSAPKGPQELKKEPSATILSNTSRLRPPLPSGSPKVHSPKLTAASFLNNISPPPEMDAALANLSTTLGKIDGITATTELKSSDITALLRDQNSCPSNEQDALTAASGIPALDPLLRMMELSSNDFVQSFSTFAGSSSLTSHSSSSPASDKRPSFIRSVVASALALLRAPCLFADLAIMASSCIPMVMRSSTPRALPSPSRHLLNDLKTCALSLHCPLVDHLGPLIATLHMTSSSAREAASYFRLLHEELKTLTLGLIQGLRSVQDLHHRATAALPIDSSVKRQDVPRQQDVDAISNLTSGLEALSFSFDSVFSHPQHKSSNLGIRSGDQQPATFHPSCFTPLLNGYLIIISVVISSWSLSFNEVWDMARAHAVHEGHEMKRQAELQAPLRPLKPSTVASDGTPAPAPADDEDDQETAKMEEVWRKKVRRGSMTLVKAVTWKPLTEEETAGLEEKLAFKREALAKCEAALRECEERLAVSLEESETYRIKMEEFGASLSLERLNNHQRMLASSLFDGDRTTGGMRNTNARASSSAIGIVTSSSARFGHSPSGERKSLMAAVSSIFKF